MTSFQANYPNSTMLYGQTIGSVSSNSFITVFNTRNPTSNDANFSIQQRWINTTSPVKEWVLTSFSNSTGQTLANWTLLTTGGTPPVLTILGGTGTSGFPVSPDGSGNLTFSSNSSTINITGTTNSINFDVNGSKVVQQFTVQTGSPTTITPTSGNINVNGAVVAAGTNPVQSKGTATSTYQIQVQQASAVAPTPGNNNAVGLSSFNNTQFTIDSTSGMVSYVGTQNTFTPGISFGGGSTGVTYNVQEGKYTVVANMVFFTIHLDISSIGSSSGNAAITGLPITVGAISSQVAFVQIDFVTFSANYNFSFLRPITSNTTAELWQTSPSNRVGTNLTDANFAAAITIRAQGFYFK